MEEKFDIEKVDLNDKKYAKEYNEDKLWDKIKNVAKKAGIEVIYYVLLLFYALQSSKVTVAEKALIVAALGYFILPTDLIADFVPLLGYTDDMATLAWALQTVAKNLTPEIKQQAKQKLTELIGEVDDKKIDDVVK